MTPAVAAAAGASPQDLRGSPYTSPGRPSPFQATPSHDRSPGAAAEGAARLPPSPPAAAAPPPPPQLPMPVAEDSAASVDRDSDVSPDRASLDVRGEGAGGWAARSPRGRARPTPLALPPMAGSSSPPPHPPQQVLDTARSDVCPTAKLQRMQKRMDALRKLFGLPPEEARACRRRAALRRCGCCFVQPSAGHRAAARPPAARRRFWRTLRAR